MTITNISYEQYDCDELEDIVDDVSYALKNRKKIIEMLAFVNTSGAINALLEVLNIRKKKDEQNYNLAPYGRIVIAGATEVAKQNLCYIAKKLNIDETRLEFHLEYNSLQKLNYAFTKNNNNVACIIASYQPHSGVSADGFASVISAISKKKGYPLVYKLFGNNGITVTSFKNALVNLLDKGIIRIKTATNKHWRK